MAGMATLLGVKQSPSAKATNGQADDGASCGLQLAKNQLRSHIVLWLAVELAAARSLVAMTAPVGIPANMVAPMEELGQPWKLTNPVVAIWSVLR
jgi:hypothetical protein